MLNHYEYAAIDNDDIVEIRGSKKHCFDCKSRRRFEIEHSFKRFLSPYPLLNGGANAKAYFFFDTKSRCC